VPHNIRVTDVHGTLSYDEATDFSVVACNSSRITAEENYVRSVCRQKLMCSVLTTGSQSMKSLLTHDHH
jgi:hypothetical protein